MRSSIQISLKESQPSCYNFSQNTSLPTKFDFKTANETENLPPNTIWDALNDLNYEELSTLLQDKDLNIVDRQGYSLINRCIILQMIRTNALPKYDGKYYDMLVFLIEKGCDVNFKSNGRNQFTPLNFAINPRANPGINGKVVESTNRKLNEVRIKCEIQKKIDEPSLDSITKMSVVFDRKIEIIKLLLRNGALNLTDSNGFDSVMIASNLAESNKTMSAIHYNYYCEISNILTSHFSLTVLNIVHSNLLCRQRLLAASVKHGFPNLTRTHKLISTLAQNNNLEFTFDFVCELSHKFFVNSNDIILPFNDNFQLIFCITQYFELENFFYYFSYVTKMKGSPLKSCVKLKFNKPELGEIYLFSNVIVHLDTNNNLHWIFPYTITDHLSRVEGMFPLFHSFLPNEDFDVSQIGPFFIDLISHISPNSELASEIPFLLIRYLIVLELWILHRPRDESRVYHLKEDLVKSSIFTHTTLAHYLLNNFLLFDTIRAKTSFPLQFSQVVSLWKSKDKSKNEDVSLDSKMHIFLKILEAISFQINNRDSLNNSCLHILARLDRVDFMFFLLDNLGASPFVLNSNCLTFLDIYRGINSDSNKSSEVAINIEKLEKYFSKPYTLRTLSGYVLSKLPIELLNFMNPPANIMKFVLLHLKPESSDPIGIHPKYKNFNKSHRKHRIKHITDKQISPDENRIRFDAFSVPDESNPANDSCVKFNPGLL